MLYNHVSQDKHCLRCSTTLFDAHLMSVGADRDAESTGKTKISDLEGTITVNQEILWLQVAMDDAVGVAESHTLAQLVEIALKKKKRKDDKKKHKTKRTENRRTTYDTWLSTKLPLIVCTSCQTNVSK